MPASGAAFGESWPSEHVSPHLVSATGRRISLPLMHGVFNWIGESDLGQANMGFFYTSYGICPYRNTH